MKMRKVVAGNILADREIKFSGRKSFAECPRVLRLVKFFDGETGRPFEFLTNMLEDDATEIAAIYKKRWQVELFFKMLKQNLKIKTFYHKIVETQIWIALIAHVLFLLLKNSCTKNYEKTFGYFIAEIASSIFLQRDIYAWLFGSPPPVRKDTGQMLFAAAASFLGQ